MKNLKNLAVTIAMLFCCIGANAQTFEVDGLKYSVTSSNNLTVSVQKGSTEPIGYVVIPATVTYIDKEYRVTSITYNAFNGCINLVSITIPESVTSIGRAAFRGCTNLTTINIPEGVTEIETEAFYNCSSLVSVVLPEGVTKIATQTFASCASLTSITIPKSLKSSDGARSFDGCTNLSSVFISDIDAWYEIDFDGSDCNPLYNGADLYLNGELVTELTIPNTVTAVKKYAFYGCRSLTSIVIPENVKSFGNAAFQGCVNLADVYYAGDFKSWMNLSYRPNQYAKNVYLNGELPTEIEIPSTMVTIPSYTFAGFSGLTTVTIPDCVITVDSYAFNNCSSLETVIMGNGMTAINGYTFNNCSSLQSVTMGNSVTTIRKYAFEGCNSLASITIPASVTSIQNSSFNGCTSLKDLVFEDGEAALSIGYNDSNKSSLFADCPLENLYLGRNLDYSTSNSYYYPFRFRKTLKSVVVSERVTSIGQYAFSGCSNLVSIALGNGITAIGDYAFNGCSNLTFIDLPERVTSIGQYAFSGCSNLVSVALGNGITAIGDYAFNGCCNLTFIDLPERVTSIGKYAFSGCNNLTSVTMGDNITSIGQYAFSGCSSLTSIKMSDALTAIQDYTFLDCSSLASITIPASVTSIKNYAFNGCTALESLIFADGKNDLSLGCNKIGSTLTEGKGLFYDCPLTSLYLGRDLSYADGAPNGYSPFACNSLLTSITIGDDVTTIGNYAFYKCTGFESIIMKNSIEDIGTYAFYECTGLSSISMGSGLVAIGDYAFKDCRNLLSVTIPENVTSIGYRAFNGGVKEVILKSNMPPVLKSNSLFPFDAEVVIAVPKEVYSDYSTTDYWSDWLGNITIDDADVRVKNLTLKASDDKSSLLAALGEENVKFVTDLTISGSINSYDFMLMRNQMPVLRHLNLKDASIVYNAHEHYTGYHTEDNQFPAYGLSNCKLFSLVFPESITSVGTYGVSSNKYLSEVTLFEGVTSIGNYAFCYCDALTTITLPEGLTSIGSNAFYDCDNLVAITFPKGMETVGEKAFYNCKKLASVTFLDGLISIGDNAFYGCSALEKVVLPPTVKTINRYAFQSCSNLKEIRIPSSVRTVGDYAFSGCTSLNDVYVYTVEPFSIGQSTFAKSGNQFIGTLHAPKVSYWTYYYNTQWNQFANRAEFDEPYENFYLVGDKELDSTTGAIVGEGDKNPDAEMGNNSGLIVEDDIVQDLGNVDIEHNGTDGGSIVVSGPDGCVNTGELHFHINVKAGKWYFFCFPFDVKREDITTRGWSDWVFRYYDGEERANNGKGGWKNVTSDGEGNFLKAATGYIFQCSRADVLVLTAKNQKIKHEDKYNELVAHATENMHDASWNFVGNPYLSYYEVTSEDYSAPITVWDGSKYIAIRPGDDDYQLAPFEGFFVQKPEDTYAVTYSADRQMTYNQAQESAAKARARRRAMPINPDRLLVNITLSNGEETDQTRVVFNNNAAMGYETACDAAKFETAGMTQLYTVDSRAVKYAINERPVAEGIVTMGYTAPAAGNYTLAAPRMDAPICIKDNLTGTIHDFSEGSYEFASEAGTFDDRFTVIMKAGETGIDKLETTDNSQQPIYDAAGRRVEKMEQGIYIKENRKVVKL